MAEIVAIPGMSQTMRDYVQMVREYLRDHEHLNRLVRGEETTDRMIAWATLDAISDFNGTPPMIGTFWLEDLLGLGQQALLLRMTVITILESVMMLQQRNHVNYSDGGISLGANDKTPLLMNTIRYLRGMTEQMKVRVKVQLNIEGILGPANAGVFSEYFAVNSSYGAW